MTKKRTSFEMIAKTLPGLEEVLMKELSDLGAGSITPLKRGVSFYGDTELMYRANYHLRTALKVLKPVRVFTLRNEQELYRKTKAVEWNKYMTPEQSLRVDAVVFSSIFRHSGFVALRIKDAIADYFRDRSGRRPDIDPRDPDLVIHIHISHQTCTIALDSSGPSLHKRGYRTDIHEAPLNEVLAAGMLHLAGWNPETNLLDPMCGSGTILIEAGLIANGIPPGSFRKTFAFQRWLDYDPDLFEKAIKQSRNKPVVKGEIRGSDRSGRFVSMAITNAEQAGLARKIEIRQASFEETSPPWNEGMIMMNPPYGERMKTSELNRLYKNVGDVLKQNYTGYHTWILSANKDALKHIGLRPSRKITLFNGPLEVKFQEYLLYHGSIKQKTGSSEENKQ